MSEKIELVVSEVLLSHGIAFGVGFLAGAVPFFLAWLFCTASDSFVLRWFMERANRQHQKELERDE